MPNVFCFALVLFIIDFVHLKQPVKKLLVKNAEGKSFIIDNIMKDKRTRCYTTDDPEAAKDYEDQKVTRIREKSKDNDDEAQERLVDDENDGEARLRNLSDDRSRHVSIKTETVLEEKKPMDRQVIC